MHWAIFVTVLVGWVCWEVAKEIAVFLKKPKVADDSDFGRRHGWFIERDGVKIGELEYLQWDHITQFWHDYRLSWYNPADAVAGPNAWISEKLVLRNRRYQDVVVDSFLTSPEREDGVICVRDAYVPEERIRRERQC